MSFSSRNLTQYLLACLKLIFLRKFIVSIILICNGCSSVYFCGFLLLLPFLQLLTNVIIVILINKHNLIINEKTKPKQLSSCVLMHNKFQSMGGIIHIYSITCEMTLSTVYKVCL